jgi:hypothetical protein
MPLAPIVTWLLTSVFAVGALKYIFTIFFFFGAQTFINNIFGVGFVPDWLSISALTSGWSNFKTSADSLTANTGYGNFGPLLWYMVNYFMVPYGMATLLNAQVTRFMIRRLFK